MDSLITEFVVDYMKRRTSKKNQITNTQLDSLLQTELGAKPMSEAGIRALIHHIRVHITIVNEEGENGWICGSTDGYYVSFNAIDILTHLQAFEGKIRKMMAVHRRGMSMLVNKIYYKQSELKFENHDS